MEEKLDLLRLRTKQGMNTVWFDTWTHFHLVRKCADWHPSKMNSRHQTASNPGQIIPNVEENWTIANSSFLNVSQV